ncbi:hypothetical protein ABU558_26895, partial [Escherichia coli]
MLSGGEYRADVTARRASLAAALALTAAALVACSSSPLLGPPSRTGATAIPEGPMEPLPVPASPKIP